MNLNGWLQNALSYDKDKTIGKCPKCGSAKVKVEENVHGSRRSLSLRCLACGAGVHIDGAKAATER